MPIDRPNDIKWLPWVIPNGGIDESRSDHELPPNKWASGFDVEPLPTGCRTRFGKTAVNTLPAPAIAISNSTGANVREFSNGTDDYMAQGITGTLFTGLNRLLQIAVRIRKKAGTPTAGVQCAIYTDVAGQPGVAVSGLDFANFNTVTAATINAASPNFLWIYFTCPATEAYVGSTAHIVLKSLGSVGNTYELQESTAANPYPGGAVNFGSDGLAWTNVALADLWFRYYAGGSAIQGILDYNLSDAVTERIIVVAGGEVYEEVSGVMVPVSGSDASIGSASADVHPAMTVANDTAFISDGIGTPKKFFIRSSTEYWANDGIDAPVASPTPGVAAGGLVTAGQYYLDYYYWDDTLGIQSNTRYQGIDTISATTAAGNLTITLTGLPATVARVGDRATHIRISIRVPTSGVYRFLGTAEGQIALGTTTATITTLDNITNEPTYDNDEAPLHSIATVGANQRFIAGLQDVGTPATDLPWRVMASKLDILGPSYESFPPLNFRDFGKGDGDYVTALAFISPATLIVGMKNSVWALDARRFLTAEPVLISKNVGIAGNASFVVAGRTLYFVSDSDRIKGLMMWDGSQVNPLLALDTTFKTFIPGRVKYATCAHLATGDGRFQWWTLITASGSSQNRVVMYDYALDSFSLYRHSANVLGTAAVAGGLAKVKMGGTDGIMYDADTGTTDDGTAIQATFTAKRDDFGMPDAIKRVRFVRAEADASTESSIDIRFEPDLTGFTSFTGHVDFTSSAGSFLGTGILGVFILGSGTPIISTRTGVNGVCRNVQPTWFSSSRWAMRGYSIAVQILRRRL